MNAFVGVLDEFLLDAGPLTMPDENDVFERDVHKRLRIVFGKGVVDKSTPASPTRVIFGFTVAPQNKSDVRREHS